MVCMSGEPDFELYRKDRDELPTEAEEMWENGSEIVADLEPDEVITGYHNLMDFLDETVEEEVVEIDAEWSDDGEELVELNQYWWTEQGEANAPEKTICTTCNATKRTRSEERLDELRQMHHISTGH